MNENNELKDNITLDTNEIEEPIYDQDIGEEYKIELDEIKYEEVTDISEVIVDEPIKPKKSKKTIILIIIIFILIICIILAILMKHDKERSTPTIKLLGNEVIILSLGNYYHDDGYFALDKEDGDITNKVTTSNNLDFNKPGIYKIKYHVEDNDGLENEIERTIIIESKENDFKFNLKGKQFVFVRVNSNYVEEGYEAIYKSQNIGKTVQVFGKPDRSKEGIYDIYYVLNVDGMVKALKRKVIVYMGEIMNADSDLITDLNNYLIDEIHYSNKIDLSNISSNALLYLGILSCKNEYNEIENEELVECLNKAFDTTLNIPTTTKYEGKTANIAFDNSTNSWIINRLEIPRLKDNIYKVIVSENDIYLYELYAYQVSLKEECTSDNTIYYSGVDLKEILGYGSCNISDDNMVINSNYEPVLYLHTFKLANDKYYWFSSEIIK